MSSTFPANAGSFERLKVRTRWGSTRWARQIRWRAQREADPLRDGAPGPVRDLAGRLGAGDGQDLSDGLGRHGRLAGWTRLVPQQSVDTFPVRLLHRQIEIMLMEPKQRLARAAQRLDLVED